MTVMHQLTNRFVATDVPKWGDSMRDKRIKEYEKNQRRQDALKKKSDSNLVECLLAILKNEKGDKNEPK